MSNKYLDIAMEKVIKREVNAVLDNINVEIMQVANQEEFHDEKWALGLRYAVNIIDKYKAETEQVGNHDRLEGE